jgi:hypothetical protein
MTRRSILGGMAAGALSLLPTRWLGDALARKPRFRAYAIVGFDESNVPTIQFQNNTDKPVDMVIEWASFMDSPDRSHFGTRFQLARSVPPGVGALAVGCPENGSVLLKHRV